MVYLHVFIGYLVPYICIEYKNVLLALISYCLSGVNCCRLNMRKGRALLEMIKYKICYCDLTTIGIVLYLVTLNWSYIPTHAMVYRCNTVFLPL